jgi:glycosyltransferase involved in cell wall biosynthesis
MLLNNVYFALKPFLPDRFRTFLRKWYSHRALGNAYVDWPIDEAAGRKPADWCGWPGGKQFAVVLTHDVEGPEGLRRSLALADLEESLGFRSSFNFVPEGRYRVTAEHRAQLQTRGFEVGVHDLRHDGKLYQSWKSFRRSAQRINHHLRDWEAVGFRSAFMLHRLDWLHELEIEYDASTFDTDPIEPQPDGASTIFPYWVSRTTHQLPNPRAGGGDLLSTSREGYVELPYTLPQDSTLFLFLGHKDIHVWKKKVEWIAERGGMVLLNLHPDYISQHGESCGLRKNYPVQLYQEFLQHLHDKYSGAYWHGLPRDVNRHIRTTFPKGGPRRPRHACMLAYSYFEQDNRVQRYAKALAARGDLVDVLSLRMTSSSQTDGENSPQTPKRNESSGSQFAPGIRVFHVQSRTRNEKHVTDYALRMLSFVIRSFRLINAIRRVHQFDVIHVHNVPDFLVFAAWLAKRRGTRLILDLHDLLPEFYATKFKAPPGSALFKGLLLCERISCTFADHLIVSNHLWRDKIAARTGLGNKCTAMVNHVDTQPYHEIASLRETHLRECSSNLAVFPGGFYRHQGLHVALRALAKVRTEFPAARLNLVGDGPELERLQAQVQELELTDAVQIFPPIDTSQVPAFLARAAVGIVPKLADGFGNEAYSTKIMEFMAAGLPVIASRTRIDEFYFGKGEVHFFNPGDPDDMARAWLEVLRDPLLRDRLVQAGTAYVAQHGWERHSADYLEIFDRLAENR